MKRIFLFILTNLAVMLVLNITLTLTGANRYLTANGIDYSALMIFSVIVGFTGSIISLFMSKRMAIMSMGVRIINPSAPANNTEAWLVDTVHQLADRAGIGRPDVGIYEGAPNAFATGAFKNEALVAVSTGLLQSMDEEEVTAVLGHEVAHVANGDMVTLTLIQGVVNTFVVFFARIAATFIDRALSRGDDRDGVGIGYYITTMVCEIVFGILASIIVAWFSRQREYRADAGSAQLLGSTQPMQKALARLGNLEPGELAKGMQAMGISDKMNVMALFSTHPPIESRIRALQQLGN
ncbi:protease HtpX [Pelistega europaea]|uniref:Protease HtpX homolog n=1 Tax=Pelistega europaea TaxID=106147 RepID=A0A7Y4P3X6_9BURK|nr:protease HtpX [Pelistega europaea]NOL49497.1 protease HtpX [Pelistega europaea]